MEHNMKSVCKIHQHDNGDMPFLANMPQDISFVKTAEIFQLISDATRLKILWLLCHHETCVNNIAVMVNMSSPAVSHHLRLLKAASLIENRRAGKEMYYRLASNTQAKLVHKALDDILDIQCPTIK